MSNMHYQLVRCQKCEGDLYGPVAIPVEQELSIEQGISSVESELSSSHPHHKVNGHSLKRYNDFQFPNY